MKEFHGGSTEGGKVLLRTAQKVVLGPGRRERAHSWGTQTPRSMPSPRWLRGGSQTARSSLRLLECWAGHLPVNGVNKRTGLGALLLAIITVTRRRGLAEKRKERRRTAVAVVVLQWACNPDGGAPV